MATRPKKLQVHPLVESLTKGPGGVPEPNVVVRGLPGGGENGEWRLYLNPQLSEYLSFRESDILHTQDMSSERNPLAGTQVWLKANASVRVVKTQSATVPAEFLAGSIVQRFGKHEAPIARQFAGRMGEWTIWYCSRDPKIDTCGGDKRTCQQWRTCNPNELPNDACVGSQGPLCTARELTCTLNKEVCGDDSRLTRCPKDGLGGAWEVDEIPR